MVSPASFCFLCNGEDNFSNCYIDAGQAAAAKERGVADGSNGISDAAVSYGCGDCHRTRILIGILR